MVLASCQNPAEDTGPAEAVPAQADYPSLHTVPPRPQLSYPVEQRRVIVEGLIADRENARYSNQVVRYRTGLSGLPPPETPPTAVAPDVSSAGDTAPPLDTVRDRPAGAPETEFDHYDDDVDSFLEDMAGEDPERPGDLGPGPESSAAPVGRAIVRAGAARPVDPPAAPYDGTASAAVWAIPARTPGFPTRASATEARGTSSAPARAATSLAGRAPGVVWGMVDMPDRAAAPSAAASGAHVVRARRAGASSPAPGPAVAAPAGRPHGVGQHLRPTGTAIAGRAPGVVWGMVEMPDRPIAPAAAASAAPMVDPRAASPKVSPVTHVPAPPTPIETSDRNATTVGDEKGFEPSATAMAERPDLWPPFEPPTDAAGIEISDGLIAISLTPRAESAGPLQLIDFAPGSAALPPDAATRLQRFLADTHAPDIGIKVVGDADSPALALDRALAVGLALVRSGVPAHRLQLSLASDAAGDQVQLFAVASAP